MNAQHEKSQCQGFDYTELTWLSFVVHAMFAQEISLEKNILLLNITLIIKYYPLKGEKSRK